MGFRHWLNHTARRAMVEHRMFEIYGPRDIKEVGSCWHEDDGRVVTEWEKRMMDVQESKTFSVKDKFGNVEIWHVVGKYEQAVGVPPQGVDDVSAQKSVYVKTRRHPFSKWEYTELKVILGRETLTHLRFPVEPILQNWEADNDAARKVTTNVMGRVITGATRDLRIFWSELGANHVSGWLGRRGQRILMILLAIAIVGVVITGAVGAYFAGQYHVVTQCYVQSGGNFTLIQCPLPHSVAVVTSSTSTSGIIVRTVPIP